MRIYEDLRVVQARVGIVQYVVLSLIGMLLVCFWYLQVVRGREFKDKAESNRIRILPLAAPRGPLLDRNGHHLVENRPSFNVILTVDRGQVSEATVARLARVLRIGEGQIRDRLARRAPLRPVVVKTDASLEDVAALEARRLELPEIQVEVVPLRSYPLAAAAAHTLGRVGEVTEAQLKSSEFDRLTPGALVGQEGVESKYNDRLMGKDGYRRVAVNSRGVEVKETERQPPEDGPALTLTLDADLQKAMEEAFAGRSGSGIALDPETGEILAMTSIPAYDPNHFTTGIEAAEWSRLITDPSTPLMNRVIQAQYAPGSLFKLITATAAIEEGVITPSTTFYCPGYLSIYNTVFRCHKASGHGVVNVHTALAQSCNVFFYQVGVRLEIDRIARYAKRLGLGFSTGVDLPHEASGLMPTPEWKLKTQKAPWYAGETVSVAIGQGQVTVTPIQMARVAAAIATGRLVHPHLVKAIGGQPLPWTAPEDLGIKPDTLEVVRDGMWAVVNEHGTGWRAHLQDIEVCGKTGSAQVVSHARLARGPGVEAMLPHGWFVGFAPKEHPRIAVAFMVEHGGSGGEAAAPVAHAVLARFFQSQTPPAPRPPVRTAQDTPQVEDASPHGH
jgi:penicillin-binding protein 2